MFAMASFQTAAELSDQSLVENSLNYKASTLYTYDWNVNLKTTSFGKSHDAVKGDTLEKNEDNSKISGKVEITPISRDKDGSWLLKMTLEDVLIQHTDETGSLVKESDADLQKEFSRPVYFHQMPNGEVTKFMVHAKEDASTANLKRGIISSLHTRIDASASKYSATETDVSGSYTANYSKADTKGLLTITKTRTQNDYSVFVDDQIKSEDKGNMEILDTCDVGLDTADGVFKTVNVNSKIVTANQEDRDAKDSTEGLGIWNEVDTTGTMTLLTKQSIKVVSPDFTDYADASLKAEPFDDGAGDELTDDDIAGAIDELRSAPLNPRGFERVLGALKTNSSAVSYVRTLMVNGSLSADVMGPVIGALGTFGSAEAQSVLVNDILTAGAPEMARGQAMVALALVKAPTEDTIGVLEMLSLDKSASDNQVAVLALGSAAKNLLAINGQRAMNIVSGLEQELTCASDSSEVINYLDALGNAGFNTSLKVIAPYLAEEASEIRTAAQDAQTRMTTAVPSGLIGDPADISDNRDLSRNYYWARWIGSGSFRTRLDASFHINDWNGYMTARAEAKARARVRGRYYDLMKGTGETNVVYYNGAYRRRFQATLRKGSSILYTRTHYLNCSQEYNGSLYNHTRQFFCISWNFYPLGFRVNLTVRGSGTVWATYEMDYDICSEPTYAQGRAKIIPGGYVTASASASVSFYVVKIGLTLTVDLLRTTLPARIIGKIQSTSPYLRLHTYLRLQLQPLSGRLRAWRRWRKWWGGWGSKRYWNLWSFGTGSWYYTFMNRWYPW
ncbi:MAG: hypothetical protein GY765_03295 [bacterium]|nr:hypothetical protein [bacterium]